MTIYCAVINRFECNSQEKFFVLPQKAIEYINCRYQEDCVRFDGWLDNTKTVKGIGGDAGIYDRYSNAYYGVKEIEVED